MDIGAVINAASRALVRTGPAALTMDAIAAEAGVPRAELDARFASPKDVLRELALRSFDELADALVQSVEGARSGSDAIKRFVQGYVEYHLNRLDRFRAVTMMRQIWGDEAFGLDVDAERQKMITAVRRGIDPLEKALLKDRSPSERSGGIHPRRLAFTATIVSMGFCTLRGLTQGHGFSHSDRDLLNEITGALGTATTTLRHLSALNVVSAELAQLHSEGELVEALPRMLATALELEDARLVLAASDGLPDDLPNEARTAFAEDRIVHTEAESEDELPSDVVLAAPVHFENNPVGVLVGRLSEQTLTQGHVARFETFATMAGISLENVRLYENLQAQVDARTRSLRDAQAALVQSEKMAAMGTLVAGLAHEINTPMASVVSSQDTLSKALGKLDSGGGLDKRAERLVSIVAEAGDTIRIGTSRISSILDKLKRFSRLDAATFDYADLNESIRDALPFVKPQLPPGATLETELGELPKFKCSPAQLSQLFLNVLLNAAEAIDEGGAIRVVTHVRDDRIVVKVVDDGPGIPAESLPKIFDPGFTTKGVGIGSGLGLSTCYRIATDHAGDIRVDSDEGRGTTVTIELPL
jgi:signal transduction histidine kinase